MHLVIEKMLSQEEHDLSSQVYIYIYASCCCLLSLLFQWIWLLVIRESLFSLLKLCLISWWYRYFMIDTVISRSLVLKVLITDYLQQNIDKKQLNHYHKRQNVSVGLFRPAFYPDYVPFLKKKCSESTGIKVPCRCDRFPPITVEKNWGRLLFLISL